MCKLFVIHQWRSIKLNRWCLPWLTHQSKLVTYVDWIHVVHLRFNEGAAPGNILTLLTVHQIGDTDNTIFYTTLPNLSIHHIIYNIIHYNKIYNRYQHQYGNRIHHLVSQALKLQYEFVSVDLSANVCPAFPFSSWKCGFVNVWGWVAVELWQKIETKGTYHNCPTKKVKKKKKTDSILLAINLA